MFYIFVHFSGPADIRVIGTEDGRNDLQLGRHALILQRLRGASVSAFSSLTVPFFSPCDNLMVGEVYAVNSLHDQSAKFW